MTDVSPLLRNWFPDAPDALLVHVAECGECSPDDEFEHGLWTCGVGNHIKDPVAYTPDGTYRPVYGPPIPLEVKLANAKTPWERIMIETSHYYTEQIKRDLERTLWDVFPPVPVKEHGPGDKVTFNIISDRTGKEGK